MRKLPGSLDAGTVGLVIAAALGASHLAACSADRAEGSSFNGDNGTAGVGGSGQGGAGGGDVGEPCSEPGAEEACTVHNDFGCLEGVQVCEDGTWSECRFAAKRRGRQDAIDVGDLPGQGANPLPTMESPSRSVVHRGADAAAHLLGDRADGSAQRAIGDACTTSADCDTAADEYCAGALGAGQCAVAEDCGDALTSANVCDPECGGVAPIPPDFGSGGLGFGWESGSLGALPFDVLDVGLPTNCNAANPCQFDHQCVAGECVPFAPGETACATADGAVGVPCDGMVPVCNRGGTDLVFNNDHLDWRTLPGALGSGNGSPDQVGENSCGGIGGHKHCDIPDQTLAPGECTMVDCTATGAPSGDMPVTPGAWLKLHLSDCDCANNWSYMHDPNACGGPSCGGGVNLAGGPVPVSLYTWVDRSGSMNTTRQNTVCRGLQSFVTDPASAGIGWEYRYWPENWSAASTCPLQAGCGGCGSTAVSGMFNARSTLPGFTLNGTAHGCNFPALPANATFAVSTALPLFPTGFVSGTPTLSALTGALARATARKIANPAEAVVVVLVTDGAPFHLTCNTAWTDIQNAAIAAFGSSSRVYTAAVGIGMGCPSGDCTQMDTLAANGGTGTAIQLAGNGDPAALTAALNEIRNKFSCSRTVPDPLPAGTTPADLVVNYNDGVNPPLALTPVADLAACSGTAGAREYYYAPGTTTLCPVACGEIGNNIGTNIETVVPCGPTASPITTSDVFTAGDSCDSLPGTFPKWTIMLYDAVTPDPSTIAVRARTRISASDAWRPFHDVVTIQAVPDNQVSDAASPTSLADALGPEALGADIEIEFTSTVGGGAPTLNGYEVHFTCEYTE